LQATYWKKLKIEFRREFDVLVTEQNGGKVFKHK
jgi:hypothetical protein